MSPLNSGQHLLTDQFLQLYITRNMKIWKKLSFQDGITRLSQYESRMTYKKFKYCWKPSLIHTVIKYLKQWNSYHILLWFKRINQEISKTFLLKCKFVHKRMEHSKKREIKIPVSVSYLKFWVLLGSYWSTGVDQNFPELIRSKTLL